MPLNPGTTLGPYAVTAKIGEGGREVVKRLLAPRIVFGLGAAMLTAVSCATEAPETVQEPQALERLTSDAEADIEALLDTYVQAVNQADADLLISAWAADGEMSLVNPMLRMQSMEELRGFFQGLKESFTTRRLQRSNVVVRTEGSVGWAVYDWAFDGTTSDGQAIQTSGWETQVYRRTDAGWRIAHVHYSVPAAPPAPQP